MEFKEAVIHVFSNYATFSGRARRSEFWNFWLFTFIVSAALSLLAIIFKNSSFLVTICSGLSSIFSLAVLIPNLAVSWRRLHDTGRSGAWWFIIFVPLVGVILLLVWFCKDSEPGDNQYGPNPKETNPWG